MPASTMDGVDREPGTSRIDLTTPGQPWFLDTVPAPATPEAGENFERISETDILIATSFEWIEMEGAARGIYAEVDFVPAVFHGDDKSRVARRFWLAWGDRALARAVLSSTESGLFTRRVFMAAEGTKAFGKWAMTWGRELKSVRALAIHGYGGRNAVPCHGCEQRLATFRSGPGHLSPVMAPFFECVSLPGHFLGRCSNCTHYGVGRECSYDDDAVRESVGFGHIDPFTLRRRPSGDGVASFLPTHGGLSASGQAHRCNYRDIQQLSRDQMERWSNLSPHPGFAIDISTIGTALRSVPKHGLGLSPAGGGNKRGRAHEEDVGSGREDKRRDATGRRHGSDTPSEVDDNEDQFVVKSNAGLGNSVVRSDLMTYDWAGVVGLLDSIRASFVEGSDALLLHLGRRHGPGDFAIRGEEDWHWAKEYLLKPWVEDRDQMRTSRGAATRRPVTFEYVTEYVAEWGLLWRSLWTIGQGTQGALNEAGFLHIAGYRSGTKVVRALATGEIFVIKSISGREGADTGSSPGDPATVATRVPGDIRFSTFSMAAIRLPSKPYFQRLRHAEKTDGEADDDSGDQVYEWNLYFEYCNGGTLHQRLEENALRKSHIPEVFIWHMIEQLCRAFDFLAHGPRGKDKVRSRRWSPIRHRDATTSSIFFRYPSDQGSPHAARGDHTASLPDVVLGRFGSAAAEDELEEWEDGGISLQKGKPSREWEDTVQLGRCIRCAIFISLFADDPGTSAPLGTAIWGKYDLDRYQMGRPYEDMDEIRTGDARDALRKLYSEDLVGVAEAFECGSSVFEEHAEQDLGTLPTMKWICGNLLNMAAEKVRSWKATADTAALDELHRQGVAREPPSRSTLNLRSEKDRKRLKAVLTRRGYVMDPRACEVYPSGRVVERDGSPLWLDEHAVGRISSWARADEDGSDGGYEDSIPTTADEEDETE